MGNLFKKNDFMAGASMSEFKERAVQEASEVLSVISNIPNMTNEVMLLLLCHCISIGVYGDNKINSKEKELINGFFEELCPGAPMDAVFEEIETPVDERAYKIVKDMYAMSLELGMHLTNMILCFAYVDGIFEEEVSQVLSDIATSSANIFAGSPEDFLNS